MSTDGKPAYQTKEEVAEEERQGRLDDHQREERMYHHDYERWRVVCGRESPRSDPGEIAIERGNRSWFPGVQTGIWDLLPSGAPPQPGKESRAREPDVEMDR